MQVRNISFGTQNKPTRRAFLARALTGTAKFLALPTVAGVAAGKTAAAVVTALDEQDDYRKHYETKEPPEKVVVNAVIVTADGQEIPLQFQGESETSRNSPEERASKAGTATGLVTGTVVAGAKALPSLARAATRLANRKTELPPAVQKP